MKLLSTDKIQVVLGGAVTTNHLQLSAFWSDIELTNKGVDGFGNNATISDNTTDVDLVGNPSSGKSRLVDFMSVFNNDTTSATVTVKLNRNGTTSVLWYGILNVYERLQYTKEGGFKSFTVLGGEKIQQTSGMIASQDLTVVVIEGDQVNNNASANTLQNVTGLNFDVVAGNSYYFEIICVYSSAATTTGSRWTIDCPAVTFLNYQSEYTLTATSKTFNSLSAKQLPSASNATSVTTGNLATIWGIIKPSANGTVQVQFASEISGSAITYKSGFIRYRRIV